MTSTCTIKNGVDPLTELATGTKVSLNPAGIVISPDQQKDGGFHRLMTAGFPSHRQHSSPRPQVNLTTKLPLHSASSIAVEKIGNPDAAAVRPHHHHPRFHHPPPAPSSTSKSPISDPLRTGVPFLHNITTSYPVATSEFQPPPPVAESSITRRRLSNSPPPGYTTVRSRKQSLDQARSPTSHEWRRPIYSPHNSAGPSSSPWLPGGLLTAPPVEGKLNKSDDEREVDDKEIKKPRRHRKKKHWWGMDSSDSGEGSGNSRLPPIISMTPPSSAAEAGLIDQPLPVPSNLSPPRPSSRTDFPLTLSSLTPLQSDPDNILPLSLPGSPFPSSPVSRYHTPNHTPHPSIPDLAAEYNADQPDPSASSESARTSSSTSTRLGWSGSGRRSDSRSSAEDEDPPILGSSRSWWLQHGPVPPAFLGTAPSSSRMLRLGSATKLLPTGTRSWGRLLGLLSGTARSRSAEGSSTSRMRQRDRERDRLMSGHGKRKVHLDSRSKWRKRLLVIAPTAPWSIVSPSVPASAIHADMV